MAEHEDSTGVRIDTRAVTIELSGPEATIEAAYALWHRVYLAITPPRIELGGEAHASGLDVDRY